MKDLTRQIIQFGSKTYDIICTYYNDDFDKNYVIYTDGLKNEDGKLNIYYGSYFLKNSDFVVECIDNAYEEKMLISVLESVIEEINGKQWLQL